MNTKEYIESYKLSNKESEYLNMVSSGDIDYDESRIDDTIVHLYMNSLEIIVI